MAKLEQAVDYLPPEMRELGWAEDLTEACTPDGDLEGDCGRMKNMPHDCDQ